ncbi:MAG: cohesin domain-containing protein [Bacteroidetes bacterium]|nr:cohesin domain-containing protein [Bacteroidota bacterium]
MKPISNLLIIIIILSLNLPRAQSQVSITLPIITDAAPGPVAAQVNATGLVNMVSFQFTITYDNSKLTCTGISNWYEGIQNVMVNNNTEQGFIAFSCYNVNPVTISDGVFFTLDFTFTNGTAQLKFFCNSHRSHQLSVEKEWG